MELIASARYLSAPSKSPTGKAQKHAIHKYAGFVSMISADGFPDARTHLPGQKDLNSTNYSQIRLLAVP
ncbi:MAG: hypothetical protein U0103_23875 [Candidatus Obscuribacterales bacterium]